MSLLFGISLTVTHNLQAPVYDALRLVENDVWSTNLWIGILAILQNRVGMLTLMYKYISSSFLHKFFSFKYSKNIFHYLL